MGKSRKDPVSAVSITPGQAEETEARGGLPKLICGQQTDATAMQGARLTSFCTL